MRWRSRTPKSTRISDKSLESAALVEARRLRVHRESKRTRECRARKFPSDRKVARHCNHFLAIAARAPLRARGDLPIDRTRSILSDKLWRMPERVRSFVDRSKTCT